MEKKRVVVGMSGGVDSSVAAYLLKEQGYDVVGVTMQIWQDEDPEQVQENGGCCGLTAVDDARRVANALGIPYYVMNFKKPFEENVIDYFVREYLEGRTPNPCIACNRYVKWESLLERSLAIGAEYIATGHYAKVVRLENGRYALEQSATLEKDQTYALYNLNQEQLARTLMPVGDYTKEEVRQMAEKISVRIANKPDSQEICFVPDKDYAGFIERHTGAPSKEGDFVDLEGRVLGRHKGIAHYTVGQRKGLGLSLGRPCFVVEIRPQTGEVVVGTDQDVYAIGCIADRLNFMPFEQLEGTLRVQGKVRYNQKASDCTVRMIGEDRLECIFDTPQRAVTPGQALVLYDKNLVVGGGTILASIKKE
ncbi:tRNA 2-thiouridine(34) synthase MnmA [Anaerotalea alkaliphila]|uniref:tRNA-specific 2-thiouridylase MnmA n=1 Tax=Anaerotalea alkaliphila TaxID=2662126 RepID=A0A7X5HTC1_9FIRM|nr:tRNA 2-thiouridine(34) synthase MnmA [Anaerotalea alkaliphila]NDL66190.1 tRNA 2-thiouridine(34) synthase MnmA [Anaerotalea alkaliphila]